MFHPPRLQAEKTKPQPFLKKGKEFELSEDVSKNESRIFY